MRPALLRAYATMMPRLQAEEELRAISALAVGTGAARAEDRRAHMRALTRTAEGSARRRATMADLDALPIAIQEVPVG